ncbi:P-loop containing nucleoside triphosphate hydrolase protein [Dothidotthia symphoricarpi CBS 119687]|uniref:P-loop containing nucleoside triphosphate hydrolase protein n=1 Tax=Dothidotthia symphoricarpi CBS 119687 TaxID=1392245 RepID=A0A6A6AJG0_9PLEO|nr:P-loop containing nucleoside triphosphate hydrolase protein [Dothidotthia symphoricarpi CBS 119687]KAF2132112.1 P-loop containing nucleoside triphosphate hydrolase protein [Dothidotthia symphoricarpi CBS 119687]
MAPHADNDVAAIDEKSTNGDKSQVVNKPQSKAKGKGKGKGDAQTKERIQRLDQLYSKKKRQTYFVPTPTSRVEQEKPGQISHVVLKVRRIICDKGFPTGTEIDVKSTLLKDALSEIFEGVEGLTLNESPPVVSPELLFHARQGLSDRIKAEETKASPNKALIDELGVAVQFVAEHFSTTLETLDCMALQNEITFSLLWTLFPAKTTVYTKSNLLRAHQVLKLHKGDYGCSNGVRFFDLELRLISHDGEKMGWAETSMRIWQFEGAKKVYNLNCFPLAHHPEQESIRSELNMRGKRYVELLNAPHGTYQEYVGAAVTENRGLVVDNEYKKVIIHVSGRIMLDSASLVQLNEYTDLLRPTVETELSALSLSDADYTYCNHFVGGFAFRHKKWCLFAISHLNPVVWNSNAFSKLVMDPRKRNLIHSLVKSHRNGAETFDDMVSGKGKGLVGLLSGNPGVGKTLTAEVISEVSRRPLYMLSAGELGTHVVDVEKKLDMVLEVTRQWGCVLLIDEADVFLQERDGLDLERNALVSVFLRRLEYFQGVLIMTTNRKRTIDAAFDSRIHFKLHYGDLDVASRSAIWKNCIGSVPAAVSTAGISEKDYEQLAALKLNGRQIKNAVACAVSIAMEEKAALSVEGIRVILDMDGGDESED